VFFRLAESEGREALLEEVAANVAAARKLVAGWPKTHPQVRLRHHCCMLKLGSTPGRVCDAQQLQGRSAACAV